MSALALLPGFATRETAPADSGLAPNPSNPPNPPPSLGALGGLGDGPRSEPAIASEGKGACADDRAEIERLALALMAEGERNPAMTITDRGKALIYYRGEAMRRLDLLRQRARDAVSGPDEEREALMGEPVMALPQPATVVGLLRAASPLAGVPGARPCPGCGRGIWCSPSWRGPRPDLCLACRKGTP